MLTGITVAVGTTAVDLLSGLDIDRELDVLLRAGSAAQTWIGGAGVAINNGYLVGAGEELRLRLHGDTIWAISASSVTVDVLVVGVK